MFPTVNANTLHALVSSIGLCVQFASDCYLPASHNVLDCQPKATT
uniref:Uncharacterized protein n=1 Tax=Arundo donax TaxID=35708 RepID=A0A0A8XWM1_ARUDO